MILSTHRMDEAESLCNNIVVMINGKFVCYGSPGYLKSKYGQGYQVTIKHSEKVEDIIEKLPELTLLKTQDLENELQESKFLVENPVLSKMFENLKGMKFVDFTVTRGSLEQVFVKFAKHQIEPSTEEDEA